MDKAFTNFTPIWIYNRDEELKLILSPTGDIPHYDSWYIEQLNGAVNLEFTVPASDPRVAHIENDGRAVIRDQDGNLVEFIIREPEDSNDANGPVKRVFAEGADYELIDEWIIGYKADNVTLETALTAVLSGTRWSVGEVDDFGTQSVNLTSSSVKKAVFDLINLFGGERRYHVEAVGNHITTRYIDVLTRRGGNYGKRFEHGKDTQSTKRILDSTGIKTALYGFGASGENDGPRLTFADVEWSEAAGDPAEKPIGQTWIGDEEALQDWGYEQGQRHRFGEYSGQEEDPAELLLNTWKELQKLKEVVSTYDFKVVLLGKQDGYEHEKVRLGDTALGIDREVQPNINVEAAIIEYRQNLNDDNLDEVTIGNFRKTFDAASRIRDVEQVVERDRGNWDKKETPAGAQQKAETKAQDAITEAQKRIDEAKAQIDLDIVRLEEADTTLAQAKITLEEAQATIDDTIANPQNYKGDFVGDLIADSLIVRGPIISELATITGTITATEAVFLEATMERATFLDMTTRRGTIIDATIQNAVITGQLDSVDGTFVGDLVGANIYSANTTFVGTDLTVTDNIYLGGYYSTASKQMIFNSGARMTGNGTGQIEISASVTSIMDGDIFLGGSVLDDIQIGSPMITGLKETGHMAVAGYTSGWSSISQLAGINFRIKKNYTPSYISYSTITSNRTPSFHDISSDGFSVAISGDDSTGFIYFRGKYTA